jgi:hypothetical protein
MERSAAFDRANGSRVTAERVGAQGREQGLRLALIDSGARAADGAEGALKKEARCDFIA